ncbi:MFS transporter [Microvirga sp. TS319]|uniref:MFS transporter n=1 Tax=Microvirga sp. TS319 TaxID=3241165 RepID=UPI00351A2E85
MRRAAGFDGSRFGANFRLRLAVLLVAVLTLGLGAVSYAAFTASRQLLVPEIDQKAETVGRSLAAQVERALALGVPLSGLVGVDGSFRTVLEANGEFAQIALFPAGAGKPMISEGRAVAGGRAVAAPVRFDGKEVARIEVTGDPGYARRILHGLWSDLAVVLLISVLIALELLVLLFGVRLVSTLDGVESRIRALRIGDFSRRPMMSDASALAQAAGSLDRGIERARARHERLVARADDVGDAAARAELASLAADTKIFETQDGSATSAESIRAPLFLFMFALEMTRPFMPGYVGALASDLIPLSPTMAVGVAMALYMGIVAALQLPLAVQTARWGRGLSFRLGASVAAAGYLICSVSTGFLVFLTGHGLSAIGFALVFVAAQGHVIDTSRGKSRMRGLAIMVGAIMVAGLCGPAVGGMLAEQIGPSPTYLVISGLALLSLAIGWTIIPLKRAAMDAMVSHPAKASSLWTGLSRSPAFGVLLLGCALPAKLILFALCFYLVPMQMAAHGASAVEIGRAQIVYPMATVLLVPVFSHLSKQLDMRMPFVLGGALLTGLACLYILLPAGNWILFVILLQFGVAQAMSITPQAGLVGELASRIGAEDSAFGLYRLVERVGSALGPVVAGLLLARFGFEAALLTLGGIVAAGAVLFLFVHMGTRHRSVSVESSVRI